MRFLTRLFISIYLWVIIGYAFYQIYLHLSNGDNTLPMLFGLTFLSFIGTIMLHYLPIEKDEESDEHQQD